MDELNGILNGENVTRSLHIDHIDHRREGGRFSTSSGACNEHQSTIFQSDLPDDVWQVEFSKTFDLVRNDSERDPDLSPLLKYVDPKATHPVNLIAHVDFFRFDKTVFLPLIHDAECHFTDFILVKRFDILHETQRPIHPKNRWKTDFNMNVRCVDVKGFEQDLIQIHFTTPLSCSVSLLRIVGEPLLPFPLRCQGFP